MFPRKYFFHLFQQIDTTDICLGGTARVKLEALKDTADNAICPIKLLLIVALRLGNVQAVTVDEVLRNAAARNDKTIQWVHPKRPVLCAFGPGISRVLADKPANSHQLSHTMAHAAPIAGFLTTTIRSHDLRRGTAQDAANLVTKIKGLQPILSLSTLVTMTPRRQSVILEASAIQNTP